MDCIHMQSKLTFGRTKADGLSNLCKVMQSSKALSPLCAETPEQRSDAEDSDGAENGDDALETMVKTIERQTLPDCSQTPVHIRSRYTVFLAADIT